MPGVTPTGRGEREAAGQPATHSLRVALGHTIRRLRAEAGYVSQEAFADGAGLHRTYAGKVERGEIDLSLDSLDRIARAPLGVTPGTLLTEAERIQATGALGTGM